MEQAKKKQKTSDLLNTEDQRVPSAVEVVFSSQSTAKGGENILKIGRKAAQMDWRLFK